MGIVRQWPRAPQTNPMSLWAIPRSRKRGASLWPHRFEVPTVHNKFRGRPRKRRTVKAHRDGFFLSRQQRKVIVTPENRYDVFASLAARQARMNHEGHGAAVVDCGNRHPAL